VRGPKRPGTVPLGEERRVMALATPSSVRDLFRMQTVDVLFLCETNSAASLMAEALLNHRGDTRIRAFSAGSRPAASLLPEAEQALGQRAIPTDGLEPKSWTIFALPGGLRPHIVVDLATVTWTEPDCAALAEYMTLRWPLRDPALVDRKAERRGVADTVLNALQTRIDGELMRRIESVRQAMNGENPPATRQWA
jgi:arsenate reductase (thioredoxin)